VPHRKPAGALAATGDVMAAAATAAALLVIKARRSIIDLPRIPGDYCQRR